MTYFIKKLHVAVMGLLLTVVGQTYGDSSTYGYGECADSCYCAPCCGTGFIRADFLYWKVHQGGLVGGCLPEETNNLISSDGNVLSKFKGHSKDLDFRWDPGFRLGAGYEFGSQSWDIAAYWTHFHTHANGHHESEYNQFRWKLDYDVIDVLVGRKICMDSFTLRPFIGIRAAQIDQTVKSKSLTGYNTFLDASSFSSFSSSSFETSADFATGDFLLAEENNQSKFKGIGPLIGIEATWNLGCGFSLYACASVSSLYGHFDVNFNGFNTFLNGTNICDKSADIHSCQISTDACLGVRWQHCLCNDIQVTYQLALEQHRYFNHNRLGDYGDLCLDGASFSAMLAF